MEGKAFDYGLFVDLEKAFDNVELGVYRDKGESEDGQLTLVSVIYVLASICIGIEHVDVTWQKATESSSWNWPRIWRGRSRHVRGVDWFVLLPNFLHIEENWQV